MAHHAKQLSSRLAVPPAPTEKSLSLSVIIGHRTTLPTLHLETTKGERYAVILDTHYIPAEITITLQT